MQINNQNQGFYVTKNNQKTGNQGCQRSSLPFNITTNHPIFNYHTPHPIDIKIKEIFLYLRRL